jgi:hypothetical protein
LQQAAEGGTRQAKERDSIRIDSKECPKKVDRPVLQEVVGCMRPAAVLMEATGESGEAEAWQARRGQARN